MNATAPVSPLEPDVGEPGYVPSALVVEHLERALDHVMLWSNPPPNPDVLADARTLLDLLQQRIRRGYLVDAPRETG